MGVLSVTDIDYGQIFGPFPSYLISTDPAYVIGLLTNDKQPDSVVLRIDPNDRRERTVGVADWLPYVSSARDEEEQNMEAYPKEGCIFYRTLRIVKAGEELLVWYSKDFTQLLAVPELQTNSKRDDEQFICSHCGEMFEFPFPLRAHLKFKCAFTAEENFHYQRNNLKISPASLSMIDRAPTSIATNETRSNDESTTAIRLKNNHNNNNNGMFSSSFPDNNNSRKSPTNSPVIGHPIFPSSFSRKRTSSDNDGSSLPLKEMRTGTPDKPPKKEPSCVLSHSIEKLSKSDAPRIKEEKSTSLDLTTTNNNISDNTPTENVSAFRKVERSPHNNNNNNSLSESRVSPAPSISSLNSSPPPLTPVTLPKAALSRSSPPFSRLSTSPSNPSLYRQTVFHHSQSTDTHTHSSHPLEPSTAHSSSSSSSSISPSSSSPSSSSSFLQPPPLHTKRPSLHHHHHHHPPHGIPPASCSDKPLPATTQVPMSMYMPGIPLLPHTAHLAIPPQTRLLRPPPPPPPSSVRSFSPGPGMSAAVPHSAFPDQIPAGLLEMCRATIPTVGPLTESFAANIRNGTIQATLGKALFADRHISTLGFLKSANPMVGKLLQSTNPTMLSSPVNAMNLSQNWCAKCNATFRMTSDLVYHMRSHHKREFDPMKKKREEKLRCNICNETFRERHHLTRHMSSHA